MKKGSIIGLLLALLLAGTVLAAVYSAAITVTETGDSDRTQQSVSLSVNNTDLADNVFMLPSGLDTRITGAGAELPHMVVSDRTLFTANLSASQQHIYSYTTGGDNLTDFYIIPGHDGYITVTDNETIELGDNFIIEQSGWVDTLYLPNNALDFDGIDDIVTVSAAASLNNFFDGGGSIEVWIRPDSDGEGSSGRIANRKGSDEGWEFMLHSEAAGEAKIKFIRNFSTNPGSWSSTSTEVTIGVYNYIAVSYSSSSDSNDPIIYVNGSSVALTELATPSGTRKDDSALDLYIGNRATKAATFDGTMDEMRFSTKIRTTEEITANWNVGAGKKLEVDDDTIVLWHMDEGANSIIYDETINDNDGTIDGASWVAGLFPKNLLLKNQAILIYISNTGNITSEVIGGGNVTATDISSGEHIVKTTANITHLGIYVDGDLKDSTALSTNVTNNSENWTFMQGNVMPYADNITFTINGTLQLWFQPDTMIIGDNLPDRATSVSNNGTITWGSNPDYITLTLGALLPDTQSAATVITEGGIPDIVPVTDDESMITAGVEGEGFPFYEVFKGLLAQWAALGGPNISMPYFWKLLAVIIAWIIGTAVTLSTRNIFIGIVAYIMFFSIPTVAMGGVLDLWVPIVYGIGALCVALLTAKWSPSSM